MREAQGPRDRPWLRARRPRRSLRAHPGAALRRRAPARGDRARARDRAEADPRRRADRQPRQRSQPRDRRAARVRSRTQATPACSSSPTTSRPRPSPTGALSCATAGSAARGLRSARTWRPLSPWRQRGTWRLLSRPKDARMKARALMAPSCSSTCIAGRLRVHAVQELLAGLGVAIAVALVLAARSPASSIARLGRRSRPRGRSAPRVSAAARAYRTGLRRTAARARRKASRRQAGRAAARTDRDDVAPDGDRVTVDLGGTDISLAVLDGLAHTLPIATLTPGGIGLSKAATARTLGISRRARTAGEVTLDLRGTATP